MQNRNFNFESHPDFDDHKLIQFIYDRETGLKGVIAIHKGGFKNPTFGATRLWRYKTEFDALKDALRLSKTMSYKSALAGLNYGGSKAVLMSTQHANSISRKAFFKKYAEFVNLLSGRFVTGADLGVEEADVRLMSSVSPHIVGLRYDPVKYTALGVYYSIKICLKAVFGKKSLQGKTFAIQGLGKTGIELLKLIYFNAGKIYVSDISSARVLCIKQKFPKVEIVKPAEIHKQKVDVFSPCALGNAINFKNISSLSCRIIAGSANSQLEDKEVGEVLHKRGILYAPDYVINAGGLICVVDEYEHKEYDEERLRAKVIKIQKTLSSIIEKSKKSKRATNTIADEIAEKLLKKFE